MTQICTNPHKLPRFQITALRQTGAVTHVAAAREVRDAMERIRAAYPSEEIKDMQVKYLNVRRLARASK